MGNDIDFLDDSGVPMDGVELDSSSATITRRAASPSRQQRQLESTTNSTSANSSTGLKNDRMTNSNEAMASDSPALSHCDESKVCGNSSPEFASNNVSAPQNHPIEDLFNERGHSSSNNHAQANVNHHHSGGGLVRSFGDLFDDDDLD